MKIFMLTGALAGFALGIGLGLSARVDWPSMLWHASAGALGLGLLMRWWGGVWMRSYYESLESRRALEAMVATPAAGSPAGLNLPKKK